MENEDLKKLSRTESGLYKRGADFPERIERGKIKGEKVEKPSEYWKPSQKDGKGSRMLKIFLWSAVVLFSVSVGVIFYFWSSGGNIISSSNIDIEVKAPIQVRGGEVIVFDIFVENKNNMPIELADLIVEFPEGSFSENGRELLYERQPIGFISPRGAARKTISAVLFGEENEEKEINVVLEYRLAESNAIFAKNESYTIRIARPPVGVFMDIPAQIDTHEEIDVDVEVVSNSETVMQNLVLMLAYPTGFQFLDSNPVPIKDESVWEIGDVEPGQQRKISVHGIMVGQEEEERAFRAQVGVINENGDFIPYSSTSETLVVKKPALNLALVLDGGDDKIAFSDEKLTAKILWRNNLSEAVRNVRLEAKIRGRALDERTIAIDKGSYRTSDKTIVWTSSDIKEFKEISPGETGEASFTFSVLNPLPVSGINDKDFIITVDGEISGVITTPDDPEYKIVSTVGGKIKVGSRMQIATRALYYVGPFENIGPNPPKVGEETTYTIGWSIGNITNDFSDTKVKASMPSYMRWIGNSTPLEEKISFDENSREIVWDVGDVAAGTGILWPAREIYFQVGLMPGLTHIGEIMELISGATADGRDDFIDRIISDKKEPLTTFLFGDPKFDSRTRGIIIE